MISPADLKPWQTQLWKALESGADMSPHASRVRQIRGRKEHIAAERCRLAKQLGKTVMWLCANEKTAKRLRRLYPDLADQIKVPPPAPPVRIIYDEIYETQARDRSATAHDERVSGRPDTQR